MESLTDDLWTMVLARLPIKSFTCFKLVCTQWKSILESPFFRNLLMSVHQNSPSSSWSLMYYSMTADMVADYECDTWGLNRPLNSFIKSLLFDKYDKHKNRHFSVEAYSDAGLILIHTESTDMEKGVLYLANPVSRECVEIFLDPRPIGFETNDYCWEWGLVTRTEHGHLLGYKVVIFHKKWNETKLSYLIYSSETGMWSLETSVVNYYISGDSISLNGNLHWLAWNNNQEAVLSMNFYATSSGSVPCCVTPFPDLEKTTKFERAFTPCQGFLMYMNIYSGWKPRR
ncbi:hypothetical protein F2Q70_00000270 [Brassica cretica]|uniref:F-box domain-containing protein n=1 Tax=Brassica cretica TaxID=69181 RepID=A0A8S9IVD8_BRACR|nr:hypothetical protein F2Q70_00000270 [Brassica cretica]